MKVLYLSMQGRSFANAQDDTENAQDDNENAQDDTENAQDDYLSC